MNLSQELARIMGPLFLAIAIGVFIDRQHYVAMAQAFLRNSALYYISGAMAFVVGLAIVLHHNIWSGWPALITLIGWMSLIRGATRLLAPRAGMSAAWRLLEPRGMLVFLALPVLLFGGILTWYGYFDGA